MRVLLTILKLCGNRLESLDKVFNKEPEKKKSCNDRLINYIRDPTDRIMVFWEIFKSVVYYVGLMQDSLNLANMFLLLEPGWRLINILRAFLMLIDIVMTFFIAIPKS